MARTDNTWDTGPSGTYVRIIKPGGMDVLINGTDRYWNFAVISGFAGYGFRDNAGTIEFKNSGGAWTPAATALAYTAENVANKSTNVLTDGTSDTKYPSVKAVKDYADGLVAGLLDYRGAYDASVNTFPASGGSGTAGAIMKGDMWVVSVAGTLGGVAIQIGDYIIANTDTPGQTASKWDTLNTNIGYVPEDAANKVTSVSSGSTDTQYPSAKLLYDQLAGKISTYGSTTAKYFLAAPNAGDGTPSFRAIVASDIPALAYAPTLGADDNYVTDAEKVVIGNTSNTNTGDNATNSNYSGLASSKLNANFLSLGSLADPNINALMAWDDTDGALKFLTIGTGLSYDHATHTLSSPIEDITGKMDKIADPNANRLYGWDDTDNDYKYFTIGTNLSYNHSTHTLSAIGGTGGSDIIVTTVGDIQTQLDLVYASGGGTIFLAAGTYLLTADILIPSGVTLQGVARDSVIIDCDTSYSVKISGTNVYTTGDVTIANGATTVVGSGTTFSAGMVGRYIWLDYFWYLITAFTNTTSIEIETYSGGDLTNSAYVISDINVASKIAKLTITNAAGSGFASAYSQELTVDDILVYSCGIGIDLDYCLYPRILSSCDENTTGMNFNYVAGYYLDFNEANDNTGNGVTMTNCLNATCQNSSFDNNGGDGLSLTNCSEIGFLSSSYKNNGGQGIELVSLCNDNQFVASVVSDNVSDGIKLTATSDRNTIVGVSIANNGGYGINIAASTCDNNVVNEITYDGNVSGTLSNSGTGTSVVSGTNTGDGVYGIANTNYVKIDSATVANGEYAKFTANGLESRSTAEVLSDIGAQASGSYELTSNKATTFGTVNDTLYPTVKAVNDAITSAVVGLLDYRGAYDASGNVFPSTGGSGLIGAILKGDFWVTSVAGTLGGVGVTAGDLIIALQDTPTTSAHWDLVQHDVNNEYVTKALYDAYSILMATTDNTPIAITIAEQTVIGRITGGAIKALSATEIRTLINVADGATANVGDMVLGTVQAVTAEKTFTNSKLVILGSSTGHNTFTMANASATDYVTTVPAVTGTVALGTGTANEIAYWSATNVLGTLAVATYPSLTELAFVKGVTSAIQTQLGTMLLKAGGTMTGDITLGENTSIALDPAGSADGKYTGITITGTAGAALAFGDLIYLAAADSRWELCDADAAATGGPVLVGMCVLAAAGDASATKILLQGQIRADAKFPALTISAPVYLGETAGAIQVAIPTGADNVIKVVGWALTADEIYFNPSPEWQITVA